jgi:hypothetical protein
MPPEFEEELTIPPVNRRTVLAAGGGALLGMMLAGEQPAEAQAGPLRFAIIGDFGLAGQPTLEVANLVRSWNPQFIATTGDNNYEVGGAATIDANVGQYYHDYIYPYKGSYGAGADINRFFPILGNHDWYTAGAKPYLDYFTLPGNERYYDFTWGPVQFFMLDSDTHEPDGYTSASVQAAWLKARLAASTAQWKLVFCHHSPYSSGRWERSTPEMQWPFEAWGATAVLSGHSHQYERLQIGKIPFFINGVGGASLAQLDVPVAGSQVRFNSDYGAMLATVDATSLTFQFVTRKGVIVDTHTIRATTPPPPPPTRPAAPRYLTAGRVGLNQINLAWRDYANNEAGFVVERATLGRPFQVVARLPANATAYSDMGLNRRWLYYYRVAAYNAAGNSAYSNITAEFTR